LVKSNFLAIRPSYKRKHRFVTLAQLGVALLLAAPIPAQGGNPAVMLFGLQGGSVVAVCSSSWSVKRLSRDQSKGAWVNSIEYFPMFKKVACDLFNGETGIVLLDLRTGTGKAWWTLPDAKGLPRQIRQMWLLAGRGDGFAAESVSDSSKGAGSAREFAWYDLRRSSWQALTGVKDKQLLAPGGACTSGVEPTLPATGNDSSPLGSADQQTESRRAPIASMLIARGIIREDAFASGTWTVTTPEKVKDAILFFDTRFALARADGKLVLVDLASQGVVSESPSSLPLEDQRLLQPTSVFLLSATESVGLGACNSK
jgi:hypothetical protein